MSVKRPFDTHIIICLQKKVKIRKENYNMADKIIENNQVSITGKIVTGFTFSHQVYGEGF